MISVAACRILPPGMKTSILILLVCLSACLAAGGLFLRDPQDRTSGRLLGSGSTLAGVAGLGFDVLPGPLIQTSSPYLEGRSGWVSEHFNRLFVDALDPDPRAQSLQNGPNPRVVIHRQPFSDGPWLKTLTEDEAETRGTIESQTVEASLALELAEVRAERLLQFLVFSGFQEKIEGIGRLEREVFFPPLPAPFPELGEELAIEPHQFICRERTQRPEFLARPTSCYYLFDARRVGEAFLLRYDLLANSHGPHLSEKDPATVRLSTGQYAITPADGGARLNHIALYSGQNMPSLFDELVKDHTVDFFESMAETIRSLAPRWEASSEAEEWAEAVLR